VCVCVCVCVREREREREREGEGIGNSFTRPCPRAQSSLIKTTVGRRTVLRAGWRYNIPVR
jgi:hypothetical protein